MYFYICCYWWCLSLPRSNTNTVHVFTEDAIKFNYSKKYVFIILIELMYIVFVPIRRGFAPGFVNYKKGCTRLAAASDKVYQLLAHDRWFSPGTPASSTTKTGRHDIAEILLKVALNTINQSIFVPFDWTRALSPVCNSMNFCIFDLFITQWTFFCLTSINNMATDDGNYDSVRLKAIFTTIHKNN